MYSVLVAHSRVVRITIEQRNTHTLLVSGFVSKFNVLSLVCFAFFLREKSLIVEATVLCDEDQCSWA